MNFLFPLAWVGLLTLPLILFLHLLRDRRKHIPIPSLALWRGLEQKRRGSHFRKPPLTLMLLLQLALATFLVLSLTRPAFSFLVDYSWHTIFILDTTTSMLADFESGPQNRFEAARAMIKAKIETLPPQDTFAIINLKTKPEILFVGDVKKKLPAMLALDNLTAGATGLDLSTALTLAEGLLDRQRNNRIIVYSDFGFLIFDLGLPPIGDDEIVQNLKSKIQNLNSTPINNQALLNVSQYTLPDGRHRVFARLVNYSDEAVKQRLRILTSQGDIFNESTVQLAPQSETTQAWTLPAKTETATVEIVETDAFPLDNKAELWLQDSSQHQVLLISQTPDILAKVLRAQPDVQLTISDFGFGIGDFGLKDEDIQNPKSKIQNLFDLIVLEGITETQLTISDFGFGIGDFGLKDEDIQNPKSKIQNGDVQNPKSKIQNLLIVNPLSPALKNQRVKPDPLTAADWLTDIDFSAVYFNQVTAITLPTWSTIDLRALVQDEASPEIIPLIFHGQVENRRVMVWAFNLADSNLSARLAFPLLMNNTLSMLLAPLPPSVVSLGDPVFIDHAFTIELPNGRRLSPSPSSGNSPFVNTQQPGLYKIYNHDNKQVAGFAVHAGSAFESNLKMQFQPIDSDTTALPTTLSPQLNYHEIWSGLAWLALSIMIIEGWLAWYR